jgi:chromosome segregation ATPase
MFKLFTKRDKRTNLEKEIDSILERMSALAPKAEMDNRTNLDKEIDSVLEELSKIAKDSEAYSRITENLEKLYKAKANEQDRLAAEYSALAESLEKLSKAKDNNTKKRNIPWEAIAVGTFSLVEVLAILNHEKIDIITSKAVGFVMKGRV